MTHRIFVYGTLERGHSNTALLEGSEFLGEAATVLTYKAVTHPAYSTVGTSFPVIMRDPRGKAVAGEIYTVDDATLARLDKLEREGRSYDRVMIEVTSSVGRRTVNHPERSSTLAGRIASARCSPVTRPTRR